jgi:hypothetical protein
VTGGEFSGVDIDLLADYVGGALDGTPDETVVAGLVADDAAWRAAYEALTGGMTAVGADLRLLGADAEPMPVELAARLDAAFAALPPLTGPVTEDTDDDLVTTVPDRGRRHLHAVPPAVGSGSQRSTRPGARRALRRWGAPIAVAAGVLAFAGIGLGDLFTGGDSQDRTTSAAGSAQNAPMMDSGSTSVKGAASAAVAQSITASGTDYRRGTLGRQSRARAATTSAKPKEFGQPVPTAEGALSAGIDPPSALRRLNLRDALLACLDAIATEHGAGTIAADSVDFATFEGSPAVVVRFAADDGRWTWVSGPGCGTPGSGADTRYQVPVG